MSTDNEYMRKYMAKWRHERRNEAIAILGGKCKVCGSKENLEIDHVDPTSKTLNLGKRWSANKEVILAELEKCQVLCKGCHIEKSKIDVRIQRTGHAELQHGTYWCYKKNKCRCDLCVDGYREKSKEYKKRYRANRATIGS